MSYGVNDSLIYYEYEFDSFDATNSYDSKYLSTDWPVFKMQRPLVDIAGLKILECQIPFSFYTITNDNHSFQLNDTAGVHTVLIPIGNYTSSTLSTTLQTALSNASGSFTWTVSYDTTTGKFKITSTSSSFSLTFGTIPDFGLTNPRIILGFNAGLNQAVSGSPTTLISPNFAQVTGPNYLYVCSRALGTLVQLYLPESAELSQGGLGPEMAKIPITTNPGGVIFWSDPDPTKYFDTQSLMTIQQMDLYCVLGNDVQNPIKFNGLGFSVKFGILVNASGRTDQTVQNVKRVRYN